MNNYIDYYKEAEDKVYTCKTLVHCKICRHNCIYDYKTIEEFENKCIFYINNIIMVTGEYCDIYKTHKLNHKIKNIVFIKEQNKLKIKVGKNLRGDLDIKTGVRFCSNNQAILEKFF